MTKGAAALPRKVVAGQKALFMKSGVLAAVGLSATAAVPFVIPSEAEGSAV
jgi:hypothetical protein